MDTASTGPRDRSRYDTHLSYPGTSDWVRTARSRAERSQSGRGRLRTYSNTRWTCRYLLPRRAAIGRRSRRADRPRSTGHSPCVGVRSSPRLAPSIGRPSSPCHPVNTRLLLTGVRRPEDGPGRRNSAVAARPCLSPCSAVALRRHHRRRASCVWGWVGQPWARAHLHVTVNTTHVGQRWVGSLLSPRTIDRTGRGLLRRAIVVIIGLIGATGGSGARAAGRNTADNCRIYIVHTSMLGNRDRPPKWHH